MSDFQKETMLEILQKYRKDISGISIRGIPITMSYFADNHWRYCRIQASLEKKVGAKRY